MSINLNDEIVQDFLVEAGEILDQLGNQLVVLEQSPSDRELLNAIFRGFHTIKGGAGFLGLDHMVEVSHKAEDVFDLLRKGGMELNSAFMDVILQVVDVLHGMFDQVRGGNEPLPAPAELIASLKEIIRMSSGAAAEPPAVAVTAPEVVTQAAPTPRLDSPKENKTAAADTGSMSDDEFERLLDELQGKGPSSAVPANAESAKAAGSEQAGKPVSASVIQRAPAPVPVESRAENPNSNAPGQEKAVKSNSPSSASQADTTVRIETSHLDRIMNLVGEVVLIRNRIRTLEAGLENEEVSKTSRHLDVVTSDLQAAVMKSRMQPIKKVFGRFPRVIRDLARVLKKEINLELHGEDTELDKTLVEALADPLVHLVRNSVDHGIELPEIRAARGKPKVGLVSLTAQQEGDQIFLTITDDGAGMDPEILRNKAVEKGVLEKETAARLDDRGCFDLIFAPGFSTKTEISDVSGRGVGMDVVKTKITQLNGTIDIQSALGKGTKITVKLPLTLAIIPTLMVILGNQIFALPLVNVNEIFDFDVGHTNRVDGQEMIVVRGKALPLFYLGQWLLSGFCGSSPRGHVVVVTVGTQRLGLMVDQLIGQEEVVVKPLGPFLHGTRGVAGATITGDGRIALILDLPGLISAYARRF
jgi:two-component system chemotaxis sensor kinase CheA